MTPGREHARHFTRKVDAQRWLDEQTAAVVAGQFVDPRAGRQTFRDYAEWWRATQVHRPSTAAYHETMLRRHVYPRLGERPLNSILPSDIQGLVKAMSADLAPSTVGVVHGIVAGIFRAAVADRRTVANPCVGTRLPRAQKRRVVPLTTGEVSSLADQISGRYRALVTLAAGTGMRQGECFGLTVDRIDFLRRTVTVDRQLVTVANRAPFLAGPKTAASHRTIPLPQVVVDALAAHLAAFPAGREGLVFTTDDGKPIRRTFSRRGSGARLSSPRAHLPGRRSTA